MSVFNNAALALFAVALGGMFMLSELAISILISTWRSLPWSRKKKLTHAAMLLLAIWFMFTLILWLICSQLFRG